MRIPFSYFLLPVFLFSLVISPNVSEKALLWTLIIVHIFLYPASNGYNSYMDRDETPIGGIKKPMQPTEQLRRLVMLMDIPVY